MFFQTQEVDDFVSNDFNITEIKQTIRDSCYVLKEDNCVI